MVQRSSLLLLLLVTLLRIDPAATSDHGWPRPPVVMDGEGGAACGRTTCLDGDGTTCSVVGGKCKCGGPTPQGDGKLLCYTQDEMMCKMVSDPSCTQFNGGKADVAASCKFPMTVIKTKAFYNNWLLVGHCSLKVIAWGAKGRGLGTLGKHYIAGMEVQYEVKLLDGRYFTHSTRLYGWAKHGTYSYIEQGSTDTGPSIHWGPNITTDFPGLGSIQTVWDYTNNIGEVVADFCGTRSGYRAPEIYVDKSNPRFAPGVYITVKKTNEPEFLAPYTTICMSPNVTLEDHVDDLEKEFGKRVSKEVAFIYLLLKTGLNQKFPGAPKALKLLIQLARLCSGKLLLCAIENCKFITKITKYLRCWADSKRNVTKEENKGLRRMEIDEEKDEGGEEGDEEDDGGEHEGEDLGGMNKVLILMYRCMNSICRDNRKECENVKEMVGNSRCKRHTPQDSILHYDCSQLK